MDKTKHIEKLTRLRNTLDLIEVRGENVKVLASCMGFIEEMVNELNAPEPTEEV